MTVTTSVSPTLRTLVYPSTPEPQYPELADARFSPSTHPIAVCFSGGGPRSFSASIGQMRALRSSPLYDLIGAISVVSGGSWFGSLFTFADPSIPDDQLLGPIVNPGDISLAAIASVPHTCIGFGLTQANNKRIFDSVAGSILSGQPSNRLYARVLNSVYCQPFSIDDVDRFFALDAAAVAAIVANNPGLSADDFFVTRPQRPYMVAGATQVYPVDKDLVMRHFEYSPLYAGTEQLFQNGTPNGPFGGGFVQAFAMDSSAPQKPDATGLITVDAPLHRFAISDLMGSSGAAPGSILDKLGLPSLFAEFHYWPPQSAGAIPDPTTQKLSIVDGGDLENTGIVAMLRRQYPVVICCVNTSTPMDPEWQNKTEPDGRYQGIDSQISALFGFTPAMSTATREVRMRAVEAMVGKAPAAAMMKVAAEAPMPEALRISVPQQPIQVFPQEDWAAVQKGLMDALAAGGPVWYASQHTIQPDNPFGIPPYPNNGKVTVIWLYNQKIAQWVSALQPDVRAFLGNTSARNKMTNFPNYDTVFQNRDLLDIPELLLLTPQQVNLLADMWSWAVLELVDDIQKVVQGAVGK